jgi:hypothetical protein
MHIGDILADLDAGFRAAKAAWFSRATGVAPGT